jgi:hypothetical protein
VRGTTATRPVGVQRFARRGRARIDPDASQAKRRDQDCDLEPGRRNSTAATLFEFGQALGATPVELITPDRQR